MKYTDVLELIIFILLLFMFSGFLKNHYLCTVEYEVIGYDYEINLTGEPFYYTPEEVECLYRNEEFRKGKDLNLTCRYVFFKE